jgi:hypothetical protein
MNSAKTSEFRHGASVPIVPLQAWLSLLGVFAPSGLKKALRKGLYAKPFPVEGFNHPSGGALSGEL